MDVHEQQREVYKYSIAPALTFAVYNDVTGQLHWSEDWEEGSRSLGEAAERFLSKLWSVQLIQSGWRGHLPQWEE